MKTTLKSRQEQASPLINQVSWRNFDYILAELFIIGFLPKHDIPTQTRGDTSFVNCRLLKEMTSVESLIANRISYCCQPPIRQIPGNPNPRASRRCALSLLRSHPMDYLLRLGQSTVQAHRKGISDQQSTN
ncbi:uncharacterized protein LOC134210105 [Armigeres subalbatus]|uniref:uncharacterized protein LOC134210105 n=1 Tax=Armigeres subalbatus TaxID=124917 RepID=UPI002ED0D6F5